MRRIETLADLKEIIRINKNEHGKIDSNFHAMLASLIPVIERGGLYQEVYPQGVLLFQDEERYRNILYFLAAGSRIPRPEAEGVFLLEQQLTGREADQGAGEEAKILEAGFTFLKENLQLEASLREHGESIRRQLKEGLSQVESEGYRAVLCEDESRFREVVGLWQTYLEPTDIPLDHMIRKEGEHVICILAPDGELAAVNWWKNEGRRSEWRHTVVSPNHRRKGLGTIVLAYGFADGADEGADRVMGWAAADNLKSLAMHAKLGAVPNGRSCRQYLLINRQK